MKRAFDMLVTFDALFPNTLPPLEQLVNGNTAALAQFVILKNGRFDPSPEFLGKLKADSVKAKQFAERYDLKPADLAVTLASYAINGVDVAQKAGGNPFDNTNTVYGGFGTNVEVNAKAVRLTGNPTARRYLEKDGAYTGNASKPMLVLHTTYDQLIPSNYATGYEDLARQVGKEQLFVVKYTNGQGHCVFTPKETSTAFGQLRQWVKTGTKPVARELRVGNGQLSGK
jgi:hypothetical protein